MTDESYEVTWGDSLFGRPIPRRTKGKAPFIHTPPTPGVPDSSDLSPIIWRGRQRAVTTYGIEGDRLREGLGSNGWGGWITYMAEKSWVDVPDFVAAFSVAWIHFEVGAISLPAYMREPHP